MNTTYEAHGTDPEYIAVNRGFVQRASLSRVERFLDLACGIGTVSRMLLEAAPAANLNGIDGDPVQIELASREFARQGYEVRHGFELTRERANGKPVVTLAVGPGDQLPFPGACFDCVTITNAVHMMPHKVQFVANVHRVLQPGGLFGFNTGFYSGCYPPGTESHFLIWAKAALGHVERQNQRLRAEGKEPIRRRHGTTRGAFQNRWYSPQEWCTLLTEQGFMDIDVYERPGTMSVQALEALGSYAGIAEVVMSGYPIEVAAQALRATAGEALHEMRLSVLPRKWLEVWATKK